MKTEIKLVLIKWIDVQSSDAGLCFPDDLVDEPVSCEIVGFVIKETKNNIFIAKEVWETGQCKYIHIIPKKYISEQYDLIKKRKIVKKVNK